MSQLQAASKRKKKYFSTLASLSFRRIFCLHLPSSLVTTSPSIVPRHYFIFHRPSSLLHLPSTLVTTSSSINPRHYFIFHQLSSLLHLPSTLVTTSSSINPRHYFIFHQPSSLHFSRQDISDFLHHSPACSDEQTFYH